VFLHIGRIQFLTIKVGKRRLNSMEEVHNQNILFVLSNFYFISKVGLYLKGGGTNYGKKAKKV
jgi:hypothetical protein